VPFENHFSLFHSHCVKHILPSDTGPSFLGKDKDAAPAKPVKGNSGG